MSTAPKSLVTSKADTSGSAIADPRAARRQAEVVLILAVGICLVSFGIILAGVAPSLTRFLDNFHWTTAYSAAAWLAWIGVRTATGKEASARRWFAWGLTAQALGQILWDIQVGIGWNPFPGPSDALYIWLGPCCALGMWSTLQAHTAPGQKRAMALDAAALSVAVLAVTLALYLPRKGDMGAWPLAVLVAYPVALLSAASIGVIMMLTLRLRPDWRWLLFFATVVGSGADWMHWNSLTLDNALEDGTWFNFSFSANTLAMGVGAMVWQVRTSTDPRWERTCENILRLLPVLLVVVAAISVVLVWTVPHTPWGVQISTAFGAVLVSLLAMARQSILLSERDQLLAAEQRIRESEGRYKTLFETAQDAIFIEDGLEFIDCNESTLRMLACKREEIIGHTPLDFSPELQPDGRSSREKGEEVVHAALAGTPQFFEWRMNHPDGSVLDVEVSLNRIELDGRILLQAIVRDVRERKRAQERMERALEHEKELAREAQAGARAKSEFLAVMSHEIRTPMNGILGFAELMTHSPSLPPDFQEYLQNIITSGESLQRILDDILDFSRMEAGRLSIEKTVFSPIELIESIRFLFAHQAREKALEFRTVVPPEIPKHLEGDAGRLRQILINLVGNALKFTEQGSVVLGMRTGPAQTDNPEPMMQFFVEDTGIGIPGNKIADIFELFTQADSAMSRRHGGTGLGLTITQRLARLMGGDLAVESQPGKGARFTVTLPLAAAGLPTDASEAPTRPPIETTFAAMPPLRILVVEDDRINLKLILSLLRRLGYEPSTASNGIEALRTLEATPADCILMDIQMPGMDGIEASRRIREIEQSTGRNPVFICALTANILPADQQQCFDAGMNHYLNKPLKRDDLSLALVAAAGFLAARR